MLWRITAAVTAIYFMHGAEQSRHDAARVASEVATEAPRVLVNACLDRVDLCQQALRHATSAPHGDSSPYTGKITPTLSLKAPAAPVVEEFPLPPVRPAMLQSRKGT
jgi:hypothetical protein